MLGFISAVRAIIPATQPPLPDALALRGRDEVPLGLGLRKSTTKWSGVEGICIHVDSEGDGEGSSNDLHDGVSESDNNN